MIIEPVLFFILLTGTIALSIAIIILIASYAAIVKKHNLLLKEKDHLKLQEHKKELQILEDARTKAARILADAHFVDNNAKNEFQEQLKTVSLNEVKDFEKVAVTLLEAYKKELEDLKENTIKIASNITKDIESNTEGELKDFKDILTKETYASQKIVEQKIEEQYAQTEKEIQAYKTQRIKKVEDEIYNVIQNVARIVLGKAISLQDHEQLVIDALNKAKEKSVL